MKRKKRKPRNSGYTLAKITYDRLGAKVYQLDGKPVSEAEFKRRTKPRVKGIGVGIHFHSPGAWPMVSDAMGCGLNQEIESMATAAKLGVPTEYKRGQAIFTSAAHRKAFCEAHGYFDRNGGYSDPQPKNKTSERRID
jgi:hypothetical protein